MAASQSASRPMRPPVKLACLGCRSQRVRCDGLETCARCLRLGKKCIYIQSRRGRRRKHLTVDDSHSFSPGIGTPASAVPSGNLSMQLELDTDLFPDLLVDDDDAVFDSILFNPSYPFTGSLDFPLDGEDVRNPGVLRQYRCDRDILDAYYIWIHPTFPALPEPQYSPVDRPLDWIPVTPDELPSHCPSNPLLLAILAIVVMIPLPDRAETNTPATRRQFSSALSGRAYDILGTPSILEDSAVVRNPVHPFVPAEVADILALCLLGQYEYLQNGNMDKMQFLTREALESATRLQLHLHQPSNHPGTEDAHQRAWWTVYLCACNVTIVSCVPPIVPLKDPTSLYTRAHPKSGNWKVHVNAERLLALATLFLVNLIREFGNPAEMELIRKSMQALDAEICRSLEGIDAIQSSCPSSFHVKVALIRLHSARIKVHRYCALLDDDSSIQDADPEATFGSSAPAVLIPSSTADSSTGNSSSSRHFPFSPAHSMRYCLESARVITQTLPDVATVQMTGTDSKFYTFTPFACPIMLAGYTFLMLRHSADTACGSPVEPGHGNRELRGECDRGAASCMEVLDGFSQAWLHLGDAAMHMKEAANSL